MVYLDHAATTPILPEAAQALTAALGEVGNASSLHASGRRARRAVEEARERVAAALRARPSEVIFTGGGTESDNLAVKGLYWARRDADPRRTRVVASAVEHHAVLDSVQWLADHEGASVTWLEPDAGGRIPVDALRDSLDDTVAVASVMWANNEVGTVQPVEEMAAVAAEHGVPFHTDAVQAVGQWPVDFRSVGALTFTGHKIGGPMGVGALLLDRDLACTPIQHGGGQERDVRSGTLDVPAIVALAVATELAVQRREETARRLTTLRDELVARVCAAVPDAVYNGRADVRLPGNAHFSFPGCEGDSLLMLLDARGIECSTGSACTAGVARPSHVLLAMGVPSELARGSLRFTLGHTSTEADVAALADAIGPVVERARRAGTATARR
ncbi:MAG: cysteine desulfurase family protein [Mycobacteriales bacterium]